MVLSDPSIHLVVVWALRPCASGEQESAKVYPMVRAEHIVVLYSTMESHRAHRTSRLITPLTLRAGVLPVFLVVTRIPVVLRPQMGFPFAWACVCTKTWSQAR